CAEKNRFSNDNSNWHKTKAPAAARQRLVGAKDPHWDDRCECFGNHQAQSRLGWLQVAVERPRAFGKNQDAIAGLQDADHSFNGTAIDSFLIDWDNVQFWQNQAQQRHIQKRTASQKINRPMTRSSGQRRIEVALVIHRENYRPVLNHALPMNNPKSKQQSTG